MTVTSRLRAASHGRVQVRSARPGGDFQDLGQGEGTEPQEPCLRSTRQGGEPGDDSHGDKCHFPTVAALSLAASS